MLKKILLFLFILLYATTQAQVALQVTVLSRKDNSRMPFATVYLSSINDSIEHRTITDMEGQFNIADLPIKRYRLGISCIGYVPLDTTIAVRYPSVGGTIVKKDFYLEEDSEMLGEVVVTASSVTQSIDSKNYVITKKDLQNAITGVDLLRKVPIVTFEKATQTLKSFKGGNVKILINGVSAHQNDILAMEANEVKNIVCYDFPPAKYAGYAVVLNFITKKRVSGFNAGLSTTNAFSTGYSNDMLHAKYNHGYNQFSFIGNFAYRDYRDFDVEDDFEYNIRNDSYKSQINGKRHFGYTDTYLSATFNRFVPNKYQLNVLFSPNIQHVHRKENQENILIMNRVEQGRAATISSRSNQFVPSLNIYYNVNLGKSQELTLDIVGSLFDASKNYQKYEYSEGHEVFKDLDYQENKKYGFIGEGSYIKTYKSGATLTFGNRFNFNSLRAGIENSFGNSEYRTRMLTNYAYGEYSGIWKGIMYRLTFGVNYYYYTNQEGTYSTWIFQPKVILGHKFSDEVTVRAVYTRDTSIPTLSDLSNNKIWLTDHIITQGNPDLKNSTSNTIGIMLSYNKPWGISELMVGYNHEHHAFNQYFVQQDDYIYLRNENAKYERSYIVQGAFTLMPFPECNLLTAKIGVSYLYSKVNSDLFGIFPHHYFPLDYQVNLNFKKFFISYSGNIVSWEMKAPYLRKGEIVSTLSASYYPKENLSLSASIMWLGREARYSEKTIDGSIVKRWGGLIFMTIRI